MLLADDLPLAKCTLPLNSEVYYYMLKHVDIIKFQKEIIISIVMGNDLRTLSPYLDDKV